MIRNYYGSDYYASNYYASQYYRPTTNTGGGGGDERKKAAPLKVSPYSKEGIRQDDEMVIVLVSTFLEILE